MVQLVLCHIETSFFRILTELLFSQHIVVDYRRMCTPNWLDLEEAIHALQVDTRRQVWISQCFTLEGIGGLHSYPFVSGIKKKTKIIETIILEQMSGRVS